VGESEEKQLELPKTNWGNP